MNNTLHSIQPEQLATKLLELAETTTPPYPPHFMNVLAGVRLCINPDSTYYIHILTESRDVVAVCYFSTDFSVPVELSMVVTSLQSSYLAYLAAQESTSIEEPNFSFSSLSGFIAELSSTRLANTLGTVGVYLARFAFAAGLLFAVYWGWIHLDSAC